MLGKSLNTNLDHAFSTQEKFCLWYLYHNYHEPLLGVISLFYNKCYYTPLLAIIFETRFIHFYMPYYMTSAITCKNMSLAYIVWYSFVAACMAVRLPILNTMLCILSSHCATQVRYFSSFDNGEELVFFMCPSLVLRVVRGIFSTSFLPSKTSSASNIRLYKQAQTTYNILEIFAFVLCSNSY